MNAWSIRIDIKFDSSACLMAEYEVPKDQSGVSMCDAKVGY